MSEIFSKLWMLYQAKPAHVTVLSSGALVVDAVRLLSSEEAKKQIAALQDFPTMHTQPELSQAWQVRNNAPEQPQPEVRPAE